MTVSVGCVGTLDECAAPIAGAGAGAGTPAGSSHKRRKVQDHDGSDGGGGGVCAGSIFEQVADNTEGHGGGGGSLGGGPRRSHRSAAPTMKGREETAAKAAKTAKAGAAAEAVAEAVAEPEQRKRTCTTRYVCEYTPHIAPSNVCNPEPYTAASTYAARARAPPSKTFEW